MSRRSKGKLWRWRRAIARADEATWQERLGATGRLNWMIVEKPGRVRLSIEAYFDRKSPADHLVRKWGGRVEAVNPKPAGPAAPVRVSASLEIGHDEKAARQPGRLVIPYGIAFGSGEHATTLMLLRALAARTDLGSVRVLDLGTGSGVLALASRMLGARDVTATDFDADAIRTARANERLNFGSSRVRWAVADVTKLGSTPKPSLILANLYSEVLIQAAPRIVRAVAPGGELWLSGVLRSQQEEVAAAFRSAGLSHLRTVTRGRWLMQQWTRGKKSR